MTANVSNHNSVVVVGNFVVVVAIIRPLTIVYEIVIFLFLLIDRFEHGPKFVIFPIVVAIIAILDIILVRRRRAFVVVGIVIVAVVVFTIIATLRGHS